MARILLIEDDPTLVLSLEVALAGLDHQVRSCRTLAAVHDTLADHAFDLILLDLGLPDGDGLALCERLRARGSIVPILMLTARGTVAARVDGLAAGADDYLAKPFELPELLARVEALLRRRRWSGPGQVVQLGALAVDFQGREASTKAGPVHLTDMEFRVLEYLVDRAGEVVSRAELLERVWRLSPTSRTRTVDVFMSRLRRHVEVGRVAKILVTVRGEGYRLLI